MTDTARYADIVLPATTYLETEDLYRAYGAYYLQYAPAAVPPQGEARSNFRLAQELARRMGLNEPIYRATPREALAALLDGAKGAVAGLDPAKLRDGRPVSLAPPEGQRFAPRPGKLEFYSEQLAAAGSRADAGLAARPATRSATPRAGRCGCLPRLAISRRTPPMPASISCAAARARRSRSCIPTRPPPAVSRTAPRCGSTTIAAQSGSCSRSATRSRPGVVLVPGQRSSGETVSGTVNMLVSDRYTDLGDGATYQSTFLDVEAWRDTP